MGNASTPAVLPTAENIVALAAGFRHVIRGSEAMSTSWAPERLGALNSLVRDEEGAWRPDGLTAARLVLRKIVKAYRSAPPPARARQDIDHTAKVIARFWGVDGFPSDAVDGNPFIDRGDLSAPRRTASGGNGESVPALAHHRRSRWQDAVASHPEALAAAGTPLDLTWAEIDADWGKLRTVAHPRWEAGKDATNSWPPDPMPGGEGHWFMERMRRALAEDLRVIGPGEDDKARDAQLLNVLRRLAIDRHLAYLGTRIDTQRHYFHLRHSMARVWFTNDLLDLGGAEEFGVAVEASSKERRTVLRSQASIARMEFYSVIHEWDQEAVDTVLDRRSSARRVFLGLEQLSDALTRFEEQLSNPALHATKQGEHTFREEKAIDPSLPAYVQQANSTAREVFTMAMRIRSRRTRQGIRDYIDFRRHDDVQLRSMSRASQRTIVLADHSVSLDCVNIRDAKLQASVGELLKKSSAVAGREYSAFDSRDRAVLATKEGTPEGLARTIDHGFRGVTEIYVTRMNLSHEFSDVRLNERSSLETEHQMSLALAGGAVRILEGLMSADADTQLRKRPDVVARQVGGALHWSARTVRVLEELEKKDYLAVERYAEGYLSSMAWRVPTRIMQHRVLCAAFALAGAYSLRSVALPTVLDLDVAYEQMLSTPQITDDQVASVMQGVLFHSFLTGGMLPFPPTIAPALQHLDFLTADVDLERTGRHSIHLDGRNRMLATLTIFAQDWNYGVVGKIWPGTKVAQMLDERSRGEFSDWLAYVDALGLINSGADDGSISCLRCKWRGPLRKAREGSCPTCGATVIPRKRD